MTKQPDIEQRIEDLLDRQGGQYVTYSNLYKNEHHNFTRYQTDLRHAAAAAKAELLTIVNEAVVADGCPCLIVEPCSYACSCASSTMSGGCMRCCKYGSIEQRIDSATRLAELTTRKDKAE